jgi:tetratricopeptide (TPR) repeat protein
MRWKTLAAAGLLASLSAPLMAQDLESILDEGDKANQAGPAKPAAASKAYSALYYVLKSKIPNPHPDQSLFIQLIEAGEWDKALLQYPIAFEGKAFQKTADGRALFALTHFNAGMPITGLELLFRVEDPGKIHPEIRRMWKEAAAPSHPAWELAQITWKPGFAEVFSPEIEFRVVARDLSMMKDPKALLSLFSRLPTKSIERARAGWQLVIAYSLNNQVEESAKVLAHVMKNDPQPVSKDLMDLTAARLLYQRAMYTPAIRYYEKIPKTSEYWTDAQEEMAWSYIRKGEPQNAMAISKSLVTPAMAGQAGAEGFFVHSLSQLKVCDYPGVISSLQEFSKRFKARNSALEQVNAGSQNKEVAKVIEMLKAKKIARENLGREGRDLPRMVARDERLYHFAQAAKNFEAEAKAADLVYAKSLAMTGLQGYFDKLRKTTLDRAHTAAASAQMRVKELAKIEASEIQEILRKLHIVEAEVIQQVAVADRVIDKTRGPVPEKKGTTGAKERDVLKFPAEDEVWFDEIGNYRVNVKKACHAEGKTKS